MYNIRYVQQEDKAFWRSLNRHLPEAEFDNKVSRKMGYVLLKDDVPIGLLRYNLFLDNTPFCTPLYVSWNHQGKDCGGFVVDIPGFEQPMELFLVKGI